MQKNNIILGIDPGTGRTGWGVITFSENQNDLNLKYVAHGCIVTTQANTMQDRLLSLHDTLLSLIDTYKPNTLVVELLFFGRNARTAISVGQARGVVMLCAAKKSLPIFEYTSISVKHHLSGSGRIDKKDVQNVVRDLLNENIQKLSFNAKDKGFDDSADALAIAIHHTFQLTGRIARTKKVIEKKKVSKKKKT